MPHLQYFQLKEKNMSFDANRRRVVVTGMGVITPLGLNVQDYWQSLMEGKSAAGPITQFDASGYETKFACEVKGFDPMKYMDRKLAQRADLFALYGIAACQ